MLARYLARALVAYLLAGLFACASEAPIDAAPVQTVAAPVLACGTVFSPEPALVAEVTAAAARWTAATGCAITVGEGGTPVRLVAEIVDNGVRRPGFTHYVDDGSLVIEVTDERFDAVIPHEMGHVLFPHEGHVEDCTALMSDAGGNGKISAADLEYVCAGYGCAVMVPETEG